MTNQEVQKLSNQVEDLSKHIGNLELSVESITKDLGVNNNRGKQYWRRFNELSEMIRKIAQNLLQKYNATPAILRIVNIEEAVETCKKDLDEMKVAFKRMYDLLQGDKVVRERMAEKLKGINSKSVIEVREVFLNSPSE